MFVAVLQVDLGIPGAFSLKEKRSVVKGLLEHLRREHRVSAAEVGDLDTWNRARIGIAFVSNERRHAEGHLQRVLDALERSREATVLGSQLEVF